MVQALYSELTKIYRDRIKWSHVRGHSGHKWNDLVDSLAVLGAKTGHQHSCVPGTAWNSARLDGALWNAWSRGTTWGWEGKARLTIQPAGGQHHLKLHIRENGHIEATITPSKEPPHLRFTL